MTAENVAGRCTMLPEGLPVFFVLTPFDQDDCLAPRKAIASLGTKRHGGGTDAQGSNLKRVRKVITEKAHKWLLLQVGQSGLVFLSI